MGTTLNSLAADSGGNSDLYSDEYLTFMISHLKYIREHPDTSIEVLDQGLVHKNMNDFYGLFLDLKIRYEDHMLMLLINGFRDPLELTEDVETLIFPPSILIDRLKQLYRTTML